MDRKLGDINAYDLYTRWSSGCGVFRCFFKTTCFVSLKHYPDFILEETSADYSKYAGLLSEIDLHAGKNTLFLIDLPGEDAVKAAFMLQKQGGLKAILTFNNVLHPFGLVGNREFISSLVHCGYGLEPAEKDFEGVALVLDGLRYGQYREDELRGHFNNQYELSEGDLPPVEMLRALNFSKAVYIFQGDILEDIGNYLNYLDAEGIPVVRKEFQTGFEIVTPVQGDV